MRHLKSAQHRIQTAQAGLSVLQQDSSDKDALQECRGYAPRYPEEARLFLRGVLTACRHILAETCGPMAGCSDGRDLLPEILRGSVNGDGPLRHGSADLSGFHVAVLWAGSSVAAIGKLLTSFLSWALLLKADKATSIIRCFELYGPGEFCSRGLT